MRRLSLMLLLVVSGCSQPQKDPITQSSPVIETTAAELASAYAGNEISADAKYKDKAITVKGEVKSVSDGPWVTFKTEGREVKALMEKGQSDNSARLVAGQSVTVSGTCTGSFLGDITIKDGRIK